ncbi:glycosyltransferase [Erwinia sp. OLTSP20]|uniref:GlcNAc-transferase family protein n=1 Tax=unclassified Erwinia TaxID=2622719 RepID=UPI000C1A601B|nr:MULTISPECIES: GlcNAc-transferase family protein [unclassified Erwinia]PIJ49604.1 glycosyltransferase [Erwinia sp. OAMSP11]PIJ71600.1 glycosyltransferase [Erwinia sp. OLSSP12]PIJ82670.1 glycosyltransferase [Erwinia sp. OLCASP19]PIJ83137.1 glycosyltransferase [Erwinia sp. OLMTSP26]PIJ85303.1 glycosyltransferase [Erwinia sp. OLMDSP33]
MRQEKTIFISIASYRDSELLPTLRDMVSQAKYPERLNIAICLQSDLNTQIFINEGMKLVESTISGSYPCFNFIWRNTTVRVINIHYLSSQGACWARHLLDRCYDQQDYFLQIDSHCRFIPEWDSEMITMLESLRQESQWPVLSSYPAAYTPGEPETRRDFVSRLIFNGFTDDGIVSLTSKPFIADTPQRCGYLAAGFIFADGHFITRVPNDPNIFFMGEEISMAVRAWLQGYEFWSPHKILLWHFYTRENSPKIWEDHNDEAKKHGLVSQTWWERDREAKKSIHNMLTSTKIQTGNQDIERNLQLYQYHIGIDFSTQKIHPEILEPLTVNWFNELPSSHEQWLESLVYSCKNELILEKNEVHLNNQDIASWQVNVYSTDNTTVLTKNYTAQSLQENTSTQHENKIVLKLNVITHEKTCPAYIRICPYMNNDSWGTMLEKPW